MELKFNWKPGDVAIIARRATGSDYYVIYATTPLREGVRFPTYLAKKFGSTKGTSFSGYHTKKFREKKQPLFTELSFESMQNFWDAEKADPSKLKGNQRQAYETVMKEVKIRYTDYQHAQIAFIFQESSRRK